MLREATTDDFEYMAEHSISRGLCGQSPEAIDFVYAYELDGVMLGVGGFRLLNLATAFVWIDLSHEAGAHYMTVCRVLKAKMKEFVEDHKLRRLETYAAPDFPEAIRLLQHMGFEKEAIMKDYLPGSDAFLYRRCF